ncbi:hypothetical protein ACGFIP_32295 [Micromonospora zamorensis]|uniref:hypothetical protein n=1 Tax=Micromonospora zamorensis TaxID=709883 RepID=UPI00371245A1
MAFPASPLPVTTELYLGGTLGWVDVTADVRLSSASSGGGITVTRGRSAEGGQADPGRSSLTLRNDGRYAPRNPLGIYYGQLGRNTPVRVGVPLVVDPFDRSVSNGLGVSPDGHTWTNLGGAAGDFAVITGQARHAQPVKNTIRTSRMDQQWLDIEQVTEVSIPAVAVGASAVIGHVARYQVGSGEHYWLRMEFDVGGGITAKIARFLGGTWQDLAVRSAIPGLTYTAGQSWTLRTSVSGSSLSVRAWPTGTPEPDTWLLRTSDRGLIVPGRGGFATWAVSGNTNTTEFRIDTYQAINRRFVHEVSTWPQRWDVSGRDRWTPIEAAGILRRLGQGKSPSRSAMRRTIGAAAPAAYWPGEDGDAASQAGSAIPNHPPLRVTGDVKFSPVEAYTIFDDTSRYGTAALADLSAGGMISAIVPADVTAATATGCTVAVAAAPDVTVAAADIVIVEILTPGGTFVKWQFVHRKATLRGQIIAYNAAGTPTLVADDNGVNITFVSYDISVWQNGPNISAGILWRPTAGFVASGSVPGTLTGVTSIAVNPTRTTQPIQMPVGHIAVWPTATLPPAVYTGFQDAYGMFMAGSVQGFERESATGRLARLCAEEGVPLDMPAVPADAVQRMGWQQAGTFAELLASCVEVDGGLLFEARDQLGLVYRPRHTLYNQPPVELSYSGGHIAEPFEPVDDDDQVANDITVSRKDGSSVRAVQNTGRLAALPPPAGVGVYEATAELNLLDDEQLPNQAGWRLRLGTVDESRYPRVRANFATAAWAADPQLIAHASALDSGGLLSLGGLPAWLPPGPSKALIQGYTERLDAYDWDITWNASPGSPWDVATADGPQRAPADGSTLASGITASATTLSLASTVANGVWTRDPIDFPLDIRVGGERMTLSGITGTSSPQTATISARGVNGIVRAWPAGTEVDVWAPAIAPL